MGELLYARAIDKATGVWVYPLLFGRARIVIGPIMSPMYDDAW